MRKLEKIEIEEQLKNVPKWILSKNKIQRKFDFKDFNECMLYINKIASIANELNHHPEWYNVYNRLEITFTTHDVSGLSDLDFIFAKKIDVLISKNEK